MTRFVSLFLIGWNQADRSLEVLTQGLAGLDLSPPGPPVGGARPKVHALTCEGDVKAEPLERSQSGERTQVNRKCLFLKQEVTFIPRGALTLSSPVGRV